MLVGHFLLVVSYLIHMLFLFFFNKFVDFFVFMLDSMQKVRKLCFHFIYAFIHVFCEIVDIIYHSDHYSAIPFTIFFHPFLTVINFDHFMTFVSIILVHAAST